ncbi:MAG: hypothetical protein ACPF8V_07750, partial [Luteibaculum sp.]
MVKVITYLKNNWVTLIPTILYLIIAINVRSDYALTWDEPTEMETGKLAYNYVVNNDPAYLQHIDRDYGVFFQFILTAITETLQPENFYEATLIRRTCLILLFSVFLFVFVRFVHSEFRSKHFTILAGIILLSSPRILAHSIFNTKDLAFLCTYFFGFASIAGFCKNPGIWRIVIMCLFIGIAIDTRIIGIELLPIGLVAIIFASVSKKLNKKALVKYLSTYILLTPLVIYAFRPVLWQDPLEIIQIFQNMAKFRFPFHLVYIGQDISAQNLPWHYLATWIAISNPIIIVLLVTTSILFLPVILIKNRLTTITNKHFLWTIAVAIPVGTLLSIIMMKSVVYDGWRQIFFIYPFLILCLLYILNQGKHIIQIKHSTIIVSILLIPTIISQIRN